MLISCSNNSTNKIFDFIIYVIFVHDNDFLSFTSNINVLRMLSDRLIWKCVNI